MTVPTVAPTLATMIGLGVGIDYALFIVTRHFRGLDDGLEIDESIARATATSGGAVFFAGGTVTIALVSLAVANIPLVTTLGLMAAIAVVVAVLAALTLLPAELAIARTAHQLAARAPAHRDVRAEQATKRACGPNGRTTIGKHPLIAGLAALAILLAADDPAAVAEPRPAGHRRALDLDHRAPSVRPDHRLLRAGRQRTAAGRGLARIPGAAAASGVLGVLRLELLGAGSGSLQRLAKRRAPADPRLQTLQHDVAATSGRRRGHPDPDRQGRHDRLLQRDPEDRARRDSTPPTWSTRCARA